MKKTKLVKVLATFSSSELRKLRDFMRSPYFNKNVKIQTLLDFIIGFAPSFDSIKLNEENAFRAIYQDEVYKEQVITKLSSKLYKLIYKFINVEKEDSIRSDVNFLSFLRERNLIHEYTQHLQLLKKGIDNTKLRGTSYFYKQFLIEQELSVLQVFKGSQGTGDVNYQATVNALDKYYLVQKLIYLCHLYNRQLSAPQQTFQFELMKELEAYIPNSSYFEIPSVKIWFTTLQLLKSKDKRKHYFELKSLVMKHHEELNRVDIRNIFATVQNNASLVFENKDDYYKELFELYSFQFERGVFDDPTILTPELFSNIVTSAILLNKLSWTEAFLKEHAFYSKHREDDVHRLCMGMLAFSKKEFLKTLDFLNECRLKNIYFKLGERRLRMKVYFELQYFDMIDDSVNSFRKFLSKNKESISDLHLNAHRDFVNLTNQFLYIQKNDTKKIKNLEAEIKKILVLPEKRWLQEKIENFSAKV